MFWLETQDVQTFVSGAAIGLFARTQTPSVTNAKLVHVNLGMNGAIHGKYSSITPIELMD